MWDYARAGLFLLLSFVLAYTFRESFRRPRSHGFYRWFVFEAILAQALLNAPGWFRDPFSWHQIASWTLLCLSLVPLIAGVRALHIHGAPDAGRRQDPELLAFERTTMLVREGIFRYIRHPMYSSLLLLAWGLFMKDPFIFGAILAIAATLGILLMAAAEEQECVQVFGEAYLEYMGQTKRFIPYVV